MNHGQMSVWILSSNSSASTMLEMLLWSPIMFAKCKKAKIDAIILVRYQKLYTQIESYNDIFGRKEIHKTADVGRTWNMLSEYETGCWQTKMLINLQHFKNEYNFKYELKVIFVNFMCYFIVKNKTGSNVSLKI